jgi:transglutaminase-like putative cysteine protease
MANFLAPGRYVDSDHPAIRSLAATLSDARELFYVVRDCVAYQTCADGGSMGDYLGALETYRASSVLEAGYGYCVSKAALYTALCRAAGIPARMAFADVLNRHRSGWRLRHAMGTDLFAWHGYSEIWLHGRWIRVTPMIDREFCLRMDVPPVEFDGFSDALLQPYDTRGRELFRYVRYRGNFHDVPAVLLASQMTSQYPGLADYRVTSRVQPGNSDVTGSVT